jgi:hypothetical protein
VPKGKVSLQNVISVTWNAKRGNGRSLKTGEMNCDGKVVDISFQLENISGIITDH